MPDDDDLKAQALRLLERDPPAGPVVAPERYLPGSLAGLVETLADSGVPLSGPALASLCLKYFHAYVHPESCGTDVPLDDVTRLAGQFARRRGGSRDLAGRGELRRLLLHHGFALQMLVDLPKTVHLLTALADGPRGPEEGGFLGLDLGAGTGILLLGQYLLARRQGIAAPRLFGIEHVPHVAGRADLLLSRLGVGRVLQGDATRAAVYGAVPPGAIACVTNETLPSAGHRLYKEPFSAICAALFDARGPDLCRTRFLPEAVWVSDKAGLSWRRLSPENAFSGEDGAGEGKPVRLALMRDIELSGRRVPVERVGEAWLGLVPESWRPALCRRW